MIRKLLHTILPTSALVLFVACAFSGCEATQVGNWDGSGLDSGLSNLPQARHEAWETDSRFNNIPQSR